MSIIEELKTNLFLNEYPRNFKLKNPDFNYPDTNLKKEVVDAIFKNINSYFYLEIGSMHGGSAIVIAEYIKKHDLNTKIICIDPFCGDTNMWAWEKGIKENTQWSFLNLINGRPQIYETFLSNIKYTNNENIILPIVCTSSIGIDLIQRLYIEKRISSLPNIIYLNSAHIEEETFFELKKSYNLLPQESVLYGDDFNWPSVRNDVVKFIQSININEKLLYSIKNSLDNSYIIENKLLIYHNQWIICK